MEFDLQTISLAEIAPSRRDFLQFVVTDRSSIVVIPELDLSRLPLIDGEIDVNSSNLVKRWDECDAPAIAVRGGSAFAPSCGTTRTIAEISTAPILFTEPCSTLDDVRRARAGGADAAVISMTISEDQKSTLSEAARSMHMTPVFEVTSSADARIAVRSRATCVAFRVSERMDVDVKKWVRELLQGIDGRFGMLLFGEVPINDFAGLVGLIDGVVCSEDTLQRFDDCELQLLFRGEG